MAYKLISPAAYQEFVRTLGETQPAVAAPFWKEGKTVFELMKADYPELGPLVGPTGYIPTLLPPKKYLYPAKETLFTFDQGQVSDVPLKNHPLIMVGVRPCDLNALRQMDRVYMGESVVDPYYKARREQMILLGWDCIEHCDDLCFCESVGGLFVKSDYDLFFSPLQDDANDYIVTIGSSVGADLLTRYAQTREAGEEIVSFYQRQQAEKLSNFPKRLKENIGSVPLLLLGSYESPHWDEMGDLCFGCGACIMVCPTCSCFDVREQVNLDLQSGQRNRHWDGCMLHEFALVAGGHNFRGPRRERIRHRIYRKFKYQMQRYDEPYCTGCGRCIRACLVDINPFEILNRLFEMNLERRHNIIE